MHGRRRRLAWSGLAILALVAHVPARGVEARSGDLDPSFGAGGIVMTSIAEWQPYTFVTQLMLDGQDRIVGGGIGSGGGLLVRYLADGTLDTSFGTNGITIDERLYWTLPPPYASAADGRIYAGGYTANEDDAIILRYDANGRPDLSFGTDGARIVDFESSEIVPLPDGRLLIAGSCRWSGGPGLTRILSDGSYDPTFATNCLWYAGGNFRALGLPTPDTIVAAGIDWNYGPPLSHRVTIGRFLADGTPDPAAGASWFAASAPLPFRPILVRVQPDGRIVAVDEGEEGTITLARIGLDGSLDPSFGNGGIVTIAQPWGWGSGVGALAVQRDGRILVAGVANTFDDSDFFVARLLPDGTLDPAFGDAGIVTTDVAPTPYEYQEVVYALLEDAEGRILAGGASHDGAENGPVALARYQGRPCGDGVVDVGEACDTGAANGRSGSCCASDCTARADGSVCSTGNACVGGETCQGGTCDGGTALVCGTCNSCDPSMGCRFAPRVECREANPLVRATFNLRDPPDPRGRRIRFQWRSEEPLASQDVGDPLGASDYALCVYDEAKGLPRLRFAAGAPAGDVCGNRSCWRRKGDRMVYRDPRADPEGVTKIQIDGIRGRITLVGRGPLLAFPAFSLASPATAELRVEGGGCWRVVADLPASTGFAAAERK